MIKVCHIGASGKMGQAVLKIIEDNDEFTKDNLLNSDVVIDFSNPISTLSSMDSVMIGCIVVYGEMMNS